MTRFGDAGENSSQSSNRNSLKRSRHPSPDKTVGRKEKPKRRKSDEDDWVHVDTPDSSGLFPEPTPATERENVDPQSMIIDPPRVFTVPSETSSDFSDAETVTPRASGNPFAYATTNAAPRPRLPGRHRSEVLMMEIKPGLEFRHMGYNNDGYYTTGPARLVWGKTGGPPTVCLPLTLDIVEGFQRIIYLERFLKTEATRLRELETNEENLDDELVASTVAVAELVSLHGQSGQSGAGGIEATQQTINEKMAKIRRDKTILSAKKDELKKGLHGWPERLKAIQREFNAIMEKPFIGANVLVSEEVDAEAARRENLQQQQQQEQDPVRAEKVQIGQELLALRQQLDDAQLAFWQRRPKFMQREAEYIKNNLGRPTDLVKEEFSLRDLQADIEATHRIVQLENCLHQAQARALDMGISFDDGLYALPQEDDGDVELHSDDYAWNEEAVQWSITRVDRAYIQRWRQKTDPDYHDPQKKWKMKIPDDTRLSYGRLKDIQVGECVIDSPIYDLNGHMRISVEIWKKKMSTEGEALGFRKPVLQKPHEDEDEDDDC